MPFPTRFHGQHSSGLPVALILGGIELVRPLTLAGIPCQVVSGPKDATRFSRHAVTVFPVDWANPISNHGPELVERLVQYGARQPQPPVLFYYWDEPLLFLSRHREELAKAFRFVLADSALVEALVDKAQFWALANTRSLPVPASAILTPASQPSPPDLRHLGFPLILKPFRRDRTWDTVEQAHGGKAIRVDRPEQLADIWPRLATLEGNIIAQRYVDGPESSIESYHVYVDTSGEIAGEFTGRKIRTLPPSHGHTTALTITHAPDVARRGRELVRLLDLRAWRSSTSSVGRMGSCTCLRSTPGSVSGTTREPEPASTFPRWSTPTWPAVLVLWCRLDPGSAGATQGPPGRQAGWCTVCPLGPMGYDLRGQGVLVLGRPAALRRDCRRAVARPARLGRAVRSPHRRPRQPVRAPGGGAAPAGGGRGRLAVRWRPGRVRPHPSECVEVMAELGARCVAGNHELLVLGELPEGRAGRLARETTAWTRGMLRQDCWPFLAQLPLVVTADDLVMTHGSLASPEEYVSRKVQAAGRLSRLGAEHPGAHLLVMGHIHHRWLYSQARGTVARGGPGGRGAPATRPVPAEPGERRTVQAAGARAAGALPARGHRPPGGMALRRGRLPTGPAQPRPAPRRRPRPPWAAGHPGAAEPERAAALPRGRRAQPPSPESSAAASSSV
jgi:hypothetical protein